MVIDVCTYNGEADLLELRLNVLDGYVDQFIVVEFDKTFSGKDKPQYYDPKRFSGWVGKISHHLITEETYSKYRPLAENSPNTQGAEHWKREFMQKESIKDVLAHLKDEDIVYVGDVDEIWDPAYKISPPMTGPYFCSKLLLRVYCYWLNNRCF